MDIKKYINDENVQTRIRENLKGQTQQFIVSLLSLVNSNPDIAECMPATVLNAAMTAASLDLPINQNLGFAYIIAYNKKVKEKDDKGAIVERWEKQAQFQMGYKGFIQLAQRSGQFKTINVSDVREGELTGMDRLTGNMTFAWAQDRENLPIVGYVGYIELTNGFQKSMYMTTVELQQHGLRFSKTAQKGYGLWKDDFDAMAQKTVIKMLLSKYAPLTIDMRRAVLADQSVIQGEDEYKYVDNQPLLPEEIAADKEASKVLAHIERSQDLEELKVCKEYVTEDTQDAYMKKYEELKALKVEKAKKA